MSDSIKTWLDANPDVKSLIVGLADLNGTFRGKRLHVAQATMRLPGC